MSADLTRWLNERERIAEAATRGPWSSVRSHSYCSPHVRSPALHSAVLYGRSWSSARPGAADVGFAADARTSIPVLVKMLRVAYAALYQRNDPAIVELENILERGALGEARRAEETK